MRRTTPFGWLVCSVLITLTTFLTSVKTEAAEQGWLGVSTQELSSGLRAGLEYDGEGVLVTRVVDNSPADRAGVRKGDILVSFNSRALSTPDQLRELVTDAGPGRTVALRIVRDGDRRTLSVALESRDGDSNSWEAPTPPTPPAAPHGVWTQKAPKAPEDMDEHMKGLMGGMHWEGMRGMGGDDALDRRIVIRTPELPGMGRGRLGVRIETLNPDLASALGSGSTRGVLVLEVLGGTAAEKAGIKAGDIIVSVARESVSDTEDLVSALRNEEGAVSIGVLRRGVKRTIEATLEGAPRVMRFKSGDGQLGLGRLKEIDRPRIRMERDADREGLREELEQLRSELRELRRELEDSKR